MSDDTRLDEHGLLEALRTSEARFRAICEAAPLGIYVSEIGTGVVYVNPAMRRILGRRQDELAGQGWKRFLHPDDARSTLADRASHYDRHAAMRIDARYLRSDGSVVWTLLHAAPILEDDALRGYVGVLEDVTEHKALQAQLVMAGRLASVGTLAAGVAHEVNTPLAVTLGNLEWIQDKLRASIEACERIVGDAGGVAGVATGLRALEGPLHDARDAAQRVSLIMKDLTLFSRPEDSEQESADLGRVLASAARMASHEIKHRARLVRDHGELPRVHGSEARLGQVFLNLLINAAHAIPEGAPEAHEVVLRAYPAEPGAVAVEVRDDGVGVDSQVVERIFDPFFTTKAQGLGTGLGLAICHRIVSGLGGRIEVESTPGRGSVFRVVLRVDDAPAPTEPAAVALHAQAPAARARILVIDDDEQIRTSMELVLSEANDVATTGSAREALERLEHGERYDVVLCDLMMPEMNGIEFHAALSRSCPGLADEVVFLTGGAVTQTARDFLQAVPNARLDKPFTLDALRRLIAQRAGSART